MYQLLSDLVDAAERNRTPMARKGLYWTLATVALTFAVVFGLLSLLGI